MVTKKAAGEKPARSFDSAYSFSFAIALGLILFIAGLVISLVLGGASSIGLFFGIPLLFAGVIVPLIMMRGLFKSNEVVAPCPHCSATIKTSDATISLECPTCHGIVAVRDEKFYAVKKADQPQ